LHYFAERFDLEIPGYSFSIARFYNAARSGDETSIQHLVADGITTDQKGPKGLTPLWQAAFNGHRRIVQRHWKPNASTLTQQAKKGVVHVLRRETR
jgi:ankyrin repeat protein